MNHTTCHQHCGHSVVPNNISNQIDKPQNCIPTILTSRRKPQILRNLAATMCGRPVIYDPPYSCDQTWSTPDSFRRRSRTIHPLDTLNRGSGAGDRRGDDTGLGMDAFRIGCLGAQHAWALTFSCAPQRGKTPLRLAVQNGQDEVAKILREAGALE